MYGNQVGMIAYIYVYTPVKCLYEGNRNSPSEAIPHYHSSRQLGQNSDKGKDSYTTTIVVTMVT